jgi:phosphoserine aminotransferase
LILESFANANNTTCGVKIENIAVLIEKAVTNCADASSSLSGSIYDRTMYSDIQT